MCCIVFHIRKPYRICVPLYIECKLRLRRGAAIHIADLNHHAVTADIAVKRRIIDLCADNAHTPVFGIPHDLQNRVVVVGVIYLRRRNTADSAERLKRARSHRRASVFAVTYRNTARYNNIVPAVGSAFHRKHTAIRTVGRHKRKTTEACRRDRLPFNYIDAVQTKPALVHLRQTDDRDIADPFPDCLFEILFVKRNTSPPCPAFFYGSVAPEPVYGR